MTPNVLILADDLTGACDAAAPFAAAGSRVCAWLDAQPVEGTFDVVACDLDLRDRPAEDAARRMREAAQARATGEVRLFVKIDSTLRGPVAELCRAARDGARRALAVIVPAFPGQGRALVDGRLVVAGVPANDASSDLLRTFAATGEPVIHVPIGRASQEGVTQALARAAADGVRIVVVDGQTDAQLESIARALRTTGPDVVIAGSGGVAHALAGPARATAAPMPGARRSGPIVVFAGSPAPATRRQVNALHDRPRVRLVRLNDGMPPRADHGNDDVLVMATSPEDETADIVRDEKRSAQCLAEAARSLARAVMPRAVILIGGASARAVCREVGAKGLDLAGTAVPGMPWGKLRGGNWNEVTVITKSGGFGNADLLNEALRACRASELAA